MIYGRAVIVELTRLLAISRVVSKDSVIFAVFVQPDRDGSYHRGVLMRVVTAALITAYLARCAGPDFTVAEPELAAHCSFIIYGDTRFTNWQFARGASWPWARRALVEKIATEKPDAIFITGDIPFQGADFSDYAVFEQETKVWDSAHLRVFPVLGNHEFYERDFLPSESRGLRNWWREFPSLKGLRWYSVALGPHIYVLFLDSNFGALAPGTRQREWLRNQLAALPDSVQYVFCLLHHARIGDYLEGHAKAKSLDSESELEGYLEHEQRRLHARVIEVSGHVHNYGRFERNGVVYVISGGGGAHPVFFPRQPDDQFRGKDLTVSGKPLPNFNYVKFEWTPEKLKATVIRISNPLDGTDKVKWDKPDRFEVPQNISK